MTQLDPRHAALRDSLHGQVLRGTHGVDYHLRQCIGEGGQGWVFSANWDEPGGFIVIVKVLRPDAVSPDALRRFQREAEVLRLLSQGPVPNPHIVRFFDHAIAKMPSPVGGEPLVLPFTVLEYVNGTTLESVLHGSRGNGMEVGRVRRLLRQVAQALQTVHAQKVVHRDLKPSNILLALEAGVEIAKVTDFGLVKLVDVNLQRTATLAGATMGYAPPEQYEKGNARVSVRTDVFSFAAIAFEMLAGRQAFPCGEAENPLLVVTRMMSGPRPRLAAKRSELAPELAAQPAIVDELDRALGQALSGNPEDRPASIVDLWAKIEPLLQSIAGPQTGKPPASALPFMETAPAYSNAPKIASIRPDSSTRDSSGRIVISVAPRPPAAHTPAEGSESLSPASPGAWRFSIVTPALKPRIVRAAAFLPHGQGAIGVGPTGVARWSMHGWAAMKLPTGVDVRGLHTLAVEESGDVIFAGERGLVVRVSPSGTHETWPIGDSSAAFFGIHRDHVSQRTILVGSRGEHGAGGGIGLAIDASKRGIAKKWEVAGSSRLRAIDRLASDRYVACGNAGTLVEIVGGEAKLVGSICGGDLLAIRSIGAERSVTVGSGGHALALTPDLDFTLEAVQTTQDLRCIAIAEDGAAWAGSGKTRVLRRSASGWVRVSSDISSDADVIAIYASGSSVRAVCDDGAVIEGRLA